MSEKVSKILTVKEYIQEKQSFNNISTDAMDKKLTQALADLINEVNNPQIIFNENEEGCFCTKLYVKLFGKSTAKFIALSIYNELLGHLSAQKLIKQIVVKGLAVTPIITDSDMKNNTRGILANLKYIK